MQTAAEMETTAMVRMIPMMVILEMKISIVVTDGNASAKKLSRVVIFQLSREIQAIRARIAWFLRKNVLFSK